MNKLTLHYKWLNDVLPEGFPYPSSTVLKGPMGAGKPIIAEAFIASWLKEGGKLISMPLQFPYPAFSQENMKALYGVDLNDYANQIVFVSFNPTSQVVEKNGENQLRANLVEPGQWHQVITHARALLGNTGNIMLFATAINLPLVSDRKSADVIATIQNLFHADNKLTFLFALSTSMVDERADKISKAADNVIEGDLTQDHYLRFRILRMKGAAYHTNKQKVPFAPNLLVEAEERAKIYRTAPVKTIKNY